ncbi:MAG: hypothetical protein IPK26_19800 [Planctomycetes bacterium]|nr:hypothetical protein [Planctomycetota bacterium]
MLQRADGHRLTNWLQIVELLHHAEHHAPARTGRAGDSAAGSANGAPPEIDFRERELRSRPMLEA